MNATLIFSCLSALWLPLLRTLFLPRCSPPLQRPPLLRLTPRATLTTACAGGRTTPTPRCSGPCTATVSLLGRTVNISSDSLHLFNISEVVCGWIYRRVQLAAHGDCGNPIFFTVGYRLLCMQLRADFYLGAEIAQAVYFINFSGSRQDCVFYN